MAKLKQGSEGEATTEDSEALMALAAAKAAEANTQLRCGQCCACSGILVSMLLSAGQPNRATACAVGDCIAAWHAFLAELPWQM